MKSSKKSYLKLSLLLIFFIFYWLIVNLLFHNTGLFWLLLLAGIALTVIAKNYRKLSKGLDNSYYSGIFSGLLESYFCCFDCPDLSG